MALSKRELEGMMATGDGAWRTPLNRFHEWDSIFHFAVNVGANKQNTLCAKYIGRKQDALAPKTHWCKNGGAAFCNPPYGKHVINWVAKAVLESKHSKQAIVMLLPARTETDWFQRYVFGVDPDTGEALSGAQLICFLNTRVKFDSSKLNGKISQPAFPSVLAVYLGQDWSAMIAWTKQLQKFGCTANLAEHKPSL